MGRARDILLLDTDEILLKESRGKVEGEDKEEEREGEEHEEGENDGEENE